MPTILSNRPSSGRFYCNLYHKCDVSKEQEWITSKNAMIFVSFFIFIFYSKIFLR